MPLDPQRAVGRDGPSYSVGRAVPAALCQGRSTFSTVRERHSRRTFFIDAPDWPDDDRRVDRVIVAFLH
jgi:hypothetical protein